MAKEGRQPSMTWLFFSPSGRIGRLPFFLAWLFWFAVGSIFLVQMMKDEGDDTALALWTLALIVSGVLSTVSIAMLAIKRLHDIGYPGPLALCLFIPVLSPIVFIGLCLWPGANRANEYGSRRNAPAGD
ncbi:DUF805 domain-containing protein [Sinorhizobium medicae]|uniref:DUF805 domain-containing protein n=1 Tax=Sinorhizobium medicae TaxID=110321 RepID=A0A508WTE0_9HYPH|nr:DUF805 domain-containing protein [Sinorhizobium medicae]MDX0519669.1 DUF805 domain-containing protein [Sinorhizobium medicae]MDX0544469.1 DUF805 domain-containing protein [Sinorhizobium medicae]MDX0631924.1 DUF805 domain-containing protein [Sinorhizobium medicae]MDX0711464.1 DUF805 domain-containing protein [Sinorhizobium medicae]MDX0767909.1 DUF805 domain-containing protein [Sinorhizobium medicae]